MRVRVLMRAATCILTACSHGARVLVRMRAAARAGSSLDPLLCGPLPLSTTGASVTSSADGPVLRCWPSPALLARSCAHAAAPLKAPQFDGPEATRYLGVGQTYAYLGRPLREP